MQSGSLPWYKSILAKMALIILLLLIPSFLLYLWAYTSFEQEMRLTMEELALAGDNIIFNELESRISNNMVHQYLLHNNSDLVMAASLWEYYTEAERARRIKSVQETLRLFGMFDDLVRDTTVYIPSIGLAVSTTKHYPIPEEKLAALQSWAENPQAILSTAEGIYSVSHSAAMAGGLPRFICEVQLGEHFFHNLLNQLSVQDGGSILLLDGRQLYSQTANRTLQQGVLAYALESREPETANRTLRIAGERILYYHMQTSVPDISLILYRPYSRTLRNIQAQARMIPLFLLASIFIIVFLLAYMQGFIRRPVIKLSNAFAQLNSGKKDVRVYSRRKDEFSELFENFNDMSRRLQETIEQVYQQKIEVQRAELKQLQSQIDPHFLYNSFFLLKNRIRRGDDSGSMNLANLLGDYFRFITRGARDFVPLAEEYAHAEVYAQIQNNRFADRFRMEFGMPPELEEVTVPRLILQPVVENSIKYCVEASEETTVLRLGFRREGDTVVICVEDSGSVPDETIAALGAMLREPEGEVTALVNIHRRLCIYNGDPERGLSFRRSRLGGLAVDMALVMK